MWFSMLRASFWLSLGLLVGFLGPYAWVVDRRVAEDFAALQWQVPTRVMARPLRLQPGMPLDIAMLRAELQASAYHEDDEGADPGRFVVRGGEVLLTTRAYDDMDGAQPSRHLRLSLANQRLTALQDAGGRPLSEARIDPARIATLYGEQQEERRLLALEEVPELLLVSLQAVEDRDFKSHFGIDFGGIVRAAWTNLRHGEVRQGGSTLTQQLVRNLYLSREQTLWRKFREIVHALVIERRFSKAQILQAYINQVFLGQDGEQAVHGFGAAAEFWFGRDVEHLKPHEIALLVGMIACVGSWSAVVVVTAVQQEFGYIPEAGLPVIARELNLSRAEVHGVVTFYHEFRNHPAGTHVIRICRAEACQSVGGREIADHACRAL
ncbi:MAG TPA: transglycosylase domain-containing protein, partial [Aquimonas sp.]|nr:transglycosylase domain-containing protein [Aquimonas sp.]